MIGRLPQAAAPFVDAKQAGGVGTGTPRDTIDRVISPAHLALATSAVLHALPPAGDERDTVHLTNGKQLHGRVVLELDDRIVLRVGTREREIPRDKIARVDSLARRQAELLGRYRDMASQSADALVGLADDAEQAGLANEATLFRWRAVLLDQDHRAAHEALGHERRGDTWTIRCGRLRLSLEDAREFHSAWGNAWEMRSEHFAVRCDSGLERTVHTLLELEYAYRYFLDTFQRELELRELLEPVQVYLYKDRKQFPAQGTHIGAYFSTAENILYTYVAGRSRPASLFHEATHAILHNATGRATRGKGALPPWLDEAWADFMEAVIVPEGVGRARIELARRHGDRIRALESGEEPYSIQRLMNFKTSDYGASSRQAIKYAQGYALFTYLFESEAYRPRFLDYVRAALDGKGQASTFNKLFGRERNAIEKAHLELR